MGKRSARCNDIVYGPPINLLGRVERRQAVPASEARCAGYPSVLAIGTEAPRFEGFESCRVRRKINILEVSLRGLRSIIRLNAFRLQDGVSVSPWRTFPNTPL